MQFFQVLVTLAFAHLGLAGVIAETADIKACVMGVIKVEAEKRGYKDQQAVCAHIAELEGPVTDGVFNQCGAQGIPVLKELACSMCNYKC